MKGRVHHSQVGDEVDLSMNINRMMSHDDFDDDYMCIGLGTTFNPDEDCLEPYYEDEDDDDDEDERQFPISQLSSNAPPPLTSNPSPHTNHPLSSTHSHSPSSNSLSWSIGSHTNYSTKLSYYKKTSYIEIEHSLLTCFAHEFFQNIQPPVNENSLGIFGRVRLSGDIGRTSGSSLTSELPSIDRIQQILLHLIQHNAIEYEILICSLIYYRRVCGQEKLSSSSSTSTPCSPLLPSTSTITSTSHGFHSVTTVGSTSVSLSSSLVTIPITHHNWKQILIASLRLATKLWDDFSLMNRDFLAPLLLPSHPPSPSSSQPPSLSHHPTPVSLIDPTISINELELSLTKQLNYNLLITEIDYQRCHEMVTRNHLSLLSCSTSEPTPAGAVSNMTTPRAVSTPPSSLTASLSATRLSATGGGGGGSGSPSPAPSPAPTRQTSRSWSWKLKINRVAVSTDDEDTNPQPPR
jgi:hypothetical protein